MSFATMSMGNEMPEQDILEKFSDLEDQTINGFGRIVLEAYARGRYRSWVEAIAQYMLKHRVPYDEAVKVFPDYLVIWKDLRTDTLRYFRELIIK